MIIVYYGPESGFRKEGRRVQDDAGRMGRDAGQMIGRSDRGLRAGRKSLFAPDSFRAGFIAQKAPRHGQRPRSPKKKTGWHRGETVSPPVGGAFEPVNRNRRRITTDRQKGQPDGVGRPHPISKCLSLHREVHHDQDKDHDGQDDGDNGEALGHHASSGQGLRSGARVAVDPPVTLRCSAKLHTPWRGWPCSGSSSGATPARRLCGRLR